jgi:hypothetical protein
MSRPHRVGICIFVIVLGVLPVWAQDNRLSPVPKRKFNHHAEFESVYDKAKDQTLVMMQWYGVREDLSADDVLFINAGFAYPGRVLTALPMAVKFGIQTRHGGVSFFKGKEAPELVAIVDGERISLGKTSLEKSKTLTTIERPRQLTYETFYAEFTYAGLLRLADAKKVTLKVSQLEYDLEERHLEALRDLASRMAP